MTGRIDVMCCLSFEALHEFGEPSLRHDMGRLPLHYHNGGGLTACRHNSLGQRGVENI